MMKIELNEKMKHRIIGLAVLLSIAAIFMPAIVKKSTQRAEKEISMNLKLPQRPAFPELSENAEADNLKQDIAQLEDEIEISLENDMVEEASAATVNVAKAEPIDLSVLSDDEQKILKEKTIQAEGKASSKPAIVKEGSAEKITTANKEEANNIEKTTHLQMAETKRETVAAPEKPKKQTQAKIKSKTKLAGNYTVQLGSFSMPANANALVKQLKAQGFSAKVKKIKTKKGYLYKVYVGNAVSRLEAESLQKRLAENTKLKGFVVSGVS